MREKWGNYVNVLFRVREMGVFFLAVTSNKYLHDLRDLQRSVAQVMFVLQIHCKEVIYEAVNRQQRH